MVIKEKNGFKKFHWRYIIIDEAHRIKNENSRLSKTMRMFSCNNRRASRARRFRTTSMSCGPLLNLVPLLPEVFGSDGAVRGMVRHGYGR